MKRLQDRLHVAGWDKSQASAASAAVRKWKASKSTNKTLENVEKSSTIKAKSTVVQDAINSGEVSKTINADKQNRHIRGSKNYIEGRSYINVTIETAQKLVDELSGTGKPVMVKGKWQN